jgi:hypothetical protein
MDRCISLSRSVITAVADGVTMPVIRNVVSKSPVVTEEREVRVGRPTGATLCFDHRTASGVTVARFLRCLKERLECPDSLEDGDAKIAQ